MLITYIFLKKIDWKFLGQIHCQKKKNERKNTTKNKTKTIKNENKQKNTSLTNFLIDPKVSSYKFYLANSQYTAKNHTTFF